MVADGKSPEFASFEEFWDFYVKEHSHPWNRRLHFIGSSLGLACAAGGVLFRKKSLFVLAPIVGYGGAWIGHFFVEKNKPASFKYPLWSFKADWVMWSKMLRGQMDAEVERVLAAERAQADASPPSKPVVPTSEAVN